MLHESESVLAVQRQRPTVCREMGDSLMMAHDIPYVRTTTLTVRVVCRHRRPLSRRRRNCVFVRPCVSAFLLGMYRNALLNNIAMLYCE